MKKGSGLKHLDLSLYYYIISFCAIFIFLEFAKKKNFTRVLRPGQACDSSMKKRKMKIEIF
jgi:hypothetical protein